MNQKDVSLFLCFNYWANDRILAACEGLTPEEFTAALSPDPGWGSLRGILVHALDTEYGWRTTLEDVEDILLEETDFPDVAVLRARWEIEKAAWFEYESSLNEESLNRGYGGDPQAGPRVWEIIMHVMMHSVQHRAEAAAILTGYGHSPGELDFYMFLKEHSEGNTD